MWSSFDITPRWRPLTRLLSEAERLLGPVSAITGSSWRGSGTFPPVRITATEDAIVATAEIPGVNMADLDLSITGDTLTIKGERRPDETVPESSYHRRERPTGHFARSVTLPERVDAEKVSATYELGLLRITMPKAPEARTRKIEIGAK